MRVTKVMLEGTNNFLRDKTETLTRENLLLKDQVRLLNEIIATYSRMPALLIATERITDALAQTITRISSKF